jgi:hypothetical protein
LEKLKDTENTLFFHNEPTLGENLGYAPKEDFLLGFQGSEIPRYIWNLCAWMSVKSTHRDNNEMYFFYDNEKMIVTYDSNETKNTVVDNDGIRIEKEESIGKKVAFLLGVGKNLKKQRELFSTLNDNWNGYNLTQNTFEVSPKKLKNK